MELKSEMLLFDIYTIDKCIYSLKNDPTNVILKAWFESQKVVGKSLFYSLFKLVFQNIINSNFTSLHF